MSSAWTLQGVVPQFVAVGNQSAGKSSLLRRVGKIPLPDAVKRCTRLPILLQLRRDLSESTTTTTGIRVHLTHASGEVVGWRSTSEVRASPLSDASVNVRPNPTKPSQTMTDTSFKRTDAQKSLTRIRPTH